MVYMDKCRWYVDCHARVVGFQIWSKLVHVVVECPLIIVKETPHQCQQGVNNR